jgi:DNA-binding NtrC family response regulator
VDVRVMAATHRDLADQSARGRFREDLYFRICAIALRVPPLRERVEDIPVIAEGLLAAANRGGQRPSLSGAALAAMQTYPWPGNIREMRNVLERAVLLGDGPVIEPGDLRFERAPARPGADPGESRLTLAEVERRHIERILLEEDGKVPAAAARLGIPRSSLYYKLKQHRIASPRSGRDV